MKRVFGLLLMAVFAVGSLQAQSVGKFLKSLESGDDYAVVTVNKEMFKLISSMDIEFEEEGLKDLIDGIKQLKVYVKEDGAEKDDFVKLKSLAQEAKMTELMSVSGGDEEVHLFTKYSDGSSMVEDLLLLVHEGTENVFIEITGKVDMKQLGKLTNKVGIGGLEHLNKVDKP
jgi:hypothetical protein